MTKRYFIPFLALNIVAARSISTGAAHSLYACENQTVQTF